MATEYYYKCSFCEQESPITAKLCTNSRCRRRLNIYGVAMSREAESPFGFPPAEPAGETGYGGGLTDESPAQPPAVQTETGTTRSGNKAMLLIPAAVLLVAAIICAVVFLVPWDGGRSKWENNVLMADQTPEAEDLEALEAFGLGIPRNRIRSVTFQDDLSGMEQNARDVSRDADGSVLAWVVENGALYDLYIAAEGGINGAESCPRMFLCFTALEEITFGDAFHSDDAVSMRGMFYGCTALERVDAENLETGNVTDMYSMFYLCSSLTELDVSGFDTANVTDFSYMFRDCSGLEALDVAHFNTKNARSLHSMFNGCSGLTKLDVSRFRTKNVTDFARMFQGCSGLTALNVSCFDTSAATDLSYMFQGCSGVSVLETGGFVTGRAATMRSMFNGCSGLTKLDVSHFDTGLVTDMAHMFQYCENLTTLDVSGFDTELVTDMRSMFSGCSSLTELDVSDFDTGRVTDMAYMFQNCGAYVDASGFDVSSVTESDDFLRGTAGLSPFGN